MMVFDHMPENQKKRRLFLTLIAGLLFATPFVVVVFQAVTVVNSQIEFSRKEQYGVIYHKDLLDLFQLTQEMRSTLVRAQNGDKRALAEIKYRKKDILQAMIDLGNEDEQIAKILGVEREWVIFHNSMISQLSTGDVSPLEREFKLYTEAMKSLLGLMNDVADASNLKLDPSLETDYMADAMVISTPNIIQTLGNIRVAALSSRGATSDVLPRLQTLELQLAVYDQEMQHSLAQAHKNGKKYDQPISNHENNIQPMLTDLRKHLEDLAQSQQRDFSDVAEQVTETVDAYNAFYDNIATSFLILLNERQGEYGLKRRLVVASCVAGLAGFIVIFVFLYKNLARAERSEHDVKRYLGELEEQKTQLIRAKADADSANTAKSEFLANMSHELRTPLNSILGMTNLLQESGLQGEQRELADTVYHSSVNLLEIVNDILDLSKIEAGEMTLEHIGFDITYIFDSIILTLNHVASRKNILLTKNYEESAFPYVMGDPLRTTRILTNLIGNAIKYTDRGSVEFHATSRKLDNRRIEILCEVRDTGIGIPEEKHEHIFSKFGQADTSTTRKYGGTGLGLAITKQLVELMGGKIGVQSEIGVGSTFWFTIPFDVTDHLNKEQSHRRHRKSTGTIPAGNARILVAEDHPVNELFIKKVLQKFGVGQFEVVRNGLEAFERYKTAAWDVILLDGHMPIMNGYDTTTKIRSHERGTGKHVPIVAMTANAMMGEREKCLSYGMDDYISKPIDIGNLRDILGQWLKFEDAEAPRGSAGEANSAVPVDLTVMKTFTDDDPETEKELIEAFLEQSDRNLSVLEKTRSGNGSHAWTEAAHMLKGGAAGIGAFELQRLSNEAQHFAGTTERRAELYRKIQAEYDRVRAYLKELGLA